MDKLTAENLIYKTKQSLKEQFDHADEVALNCQEKVLNAFIENKVALRHFAGTTGYGYDDIGRDTLKKVYALVFNAEAACITPTIVSGTHAISLALYAVLKKGDKVLSLSGKPYDTLMPVIEGEVDSLKSRGVEFEYISLDGSDFDYKKINERKLEDYAMIYVQRSRGYEEREAISVESMKKCFDFVKQNGFNGIIFVDNCYGEFVEKLEPTDVGATLMAGSLIKNVGGGLAPTGGYVVGDKKYIDKVEARLTCPSIAAEVGSYAYGYQYFYQGLFVAPHVVNQAIKGSLLIGACLESLGYATIPAAYQTPYDITRSVRLGDKDKLVAFIQAVQSVSPIDSFLTLVPWDMPGYSHQVVMAAGCFIQGSSIELSCDAPIKEPYCAFIQGGLTIEHCIIALKSILEKL